MKHNTNDDINKHLELLDEKGFFNKKRVGRSFLRSQLKSGIAAARAHPSAYGNLIETYSATVLPNRDILFFNCLFDYYFLTEELKALCVVVRLNNYKEKIALYEKDSVLPHVKEIMMKQQLFLEQKRLTRSIIRQPPTRVDHRPQDNKGHQL